ncbi:AbrB/MazE/SpoVT family DNA-binding domain-containing protein [Lentibacillus salinarum]|uniref:AbrB/MazE/SpoVT family DNA-binding domain-containing protein n=1 Tax=Lentibacillus salinarum TaxID=446820 RepID=A0ABW3ZT24_9BACI
MTQDQYSTLSSKGQVTIPSEIREILNAEQGDQLGKEE